jgi:hypothetical protein
MSILMTGLKTTWETLMLPSVPGVGYRSLACLRFFEMTMMLKLDSGDGLDSKFQGVTTQMQLFSCFTASPLLVPEQQPQLLARHFLETRLALVSLGQSTKYLFARI